MFKCTFDGCERMFATEPARRGHLSTHRTKKRPPGRERRLVRLKYVCQPTRKKLINNERIPITCRLPPSRRRKPATIVVNAEEGYDVNSTIYSKPEQPAEELEQILQKLREWVASSSSQYNVKLLNWLSKLPFKTPNKYVDNRLLPFLAGIENDYLVNENITNEYLRMLEDICESVYYLPSDFEVFGITSDVEELSEKTDLKLLLVHVFITQLNGLDHSYLAAIDFTEKIITYIDTGEGLKSLTVADKRKMDTIEEIAQQLGLKEYQINIVTDAPPDRSGKFDCTFHTCLFAKCMVLKQDHRQLGDPCRKEIMYELLKGELVQ